MDLSKLAGRAKKLVDERGGMQSIVGDAKELKDIAGRSGGSAADKLKEAAAALRTPGTAPEATEAAAAEPAAGEPAAADPAPAAPVPPAEPERAKPHPRAG